MPMLANAVLHDSVNAVSIVALPFPVVPHASSLLLMRLVLVCGSVSGWSARRPPCSGSGVPWLNRAELVTILKVEPGG